jgi:talin
VRAAEEALAFDDTEQISNDMSINNAVGTTSARAMEIEAQVSILKMEKELEKARMKLAAVRKGKYQGQQQAGNTGGGSKGSGSAFRRV